MIKAIAYLAIVLILLGVLGVGIYLEVHGPSLVGAGAIGVELLVALLVTIRYGKNFLPGAEGGIAVDDNNR